MLARGMALALVVAASAAAPAPSGLRGSAAQTAQEGTAAEAGKSSGAEARAQAVVEAPASPAAENATGSAAERASRGPPAAEARASPAVGNATVGADVGLSADASWYGYCCGRCPHHPYCSPNSGNCYGWKNKNYYTSCSGSGSAPACVDSHQMCHDWAARGECHLNPNYMLTSCALSCASCR